MFKNLDTKEKAELAITGIGVLFLIFFVPASIKKVQGKKADQAKTYTESASVFLESFIPEVKKYKPEGDWGNDPFYPDISFSGAGSSGIAGLVLNGIVWDSNTPYAIINSKVVKAGDNIDTATVIVDITENSVVVEQDGNRHTLELTKF